MSELFPRVGAEVHYNEAGEVVGWDYPSTDPSDYYCDGCGACHAGPCPPDYGGAFDGFSVSSDADPGL